MASKDSRHPPPRDDAASSTSATPHVPFHAPTSRPLTLRWVVDTIGSKSRGVKGHLELLDQRQLPGQVEFLQIHTTQELWHAIKTLAVRGAPAIGVAAAYGMALAARTISPASQAATLIDHLKEQGEYLKSARPTAISLEWAVNQMTRLAITERAIGVRQLQIRLLREAEAIHEEDTRMCLAIGRHGASFVKPGSGVLTHCNAGALATSDHGTALAILYEAQRRGVNFHVFADETRPLLQGSRLTAWELAASGIDVTVICDSMAGLVMRQKKVGLVIVGADRIAANGDVANKIGTYSVAQLARVHGIPFLVAAPSNTFDLSLATGEQIPIEERPLSEITGPASPSNIKAYNPAFDVTPAHLVSAIITERGIISPVSAATIRSVIDA